MTTARMGGTAPPMPTTSTQHPHNRHEQLLMGSMGVRDPSRQGRRGRHRKAQEMSSTSLGPYGSFFSFLFHFFTKHFYVPTTTDNDDTGEPPPPPLWVPARRVEGWGVDPQETSSTSLGPYVSFFSFLFHFFATNKHFYVPTTTDNNDTGAPPPPLLRAPAHKVEGWGWRDEGKGRRQREVVRRFVLFLISIYLSGVFLGSKLLLTTGWYYTTYAHPRTSKPPPPHANGMSGHRSG